MSRTLVCLNNKSLYINLGSYMYINLEGDFIYMLVMNLKINHDKFNIKVLI